MENNLSANMETHRNTPEWLRPGLYGAAIGATAIAIIGFSWGGWVTGSTAEKLASNQVRLEVVAALVRICVEQVKQDPRRAQMLTGLRDAKGYQRRDMLIEAGWATMPGSTDANRDVATVCMEKPAAQLYPTGPHRTGSWSPGVIARPISRVPGRRASPTMSVADVNVGADRRTAGLFQVDGSC